MLWLTLFAQVTTDSSVCKAKQAEKFLGVLPKWYAYLPYNSVNGRCAIEISTKELDPKLWLVGLAIIDMLLRISVVVAVGYVIWGGIRYITSQGEPDNTKNARATILNALIGAVIALLASIVVSFIGNSLGG